MMSLLFQIISFMFPIVPCIINCVTNRISCDDTGHHLHDLFLERSASGGRHLFKQCIYNNYKLFWSV